MTFTQREKSQIILGGALLTDDERRAGYRAALCFGTTEPDGSALRFLDVRVTRRHMEDLRDWLSDRLALLEEEAAEEENRLAA